jgi:hypothetical protein
VLVVIKKVLEVVAVVLILVLHKVVMDIEEL